MIVAANLSGLAFSLGLIALAALGVLNAIATARGSSSTGERRAADAEKVPAASTEIPVRPRGPALTDEAKTQLMLYPTSGRGIERC